VVKLHRRRVVNLAGKSTKSNKLSDFGKTKEEYGKPHPIIIRGKSYQVIPLVHPRQAGNLGNSSQMWSDLHKKWVIDKMGERIEKNSLMKIQVSKKAP